MLESKPRGETKMGLNKLKVVRKKNKNRRGKVRSDIKVINQTRFEGWKAFTKHQEFIEKKKDYWITRRGGKNWEVGATDRLKWQVKNHWWWLGARVTSSYGNIFKAKENQAYPQNYHHSMSLHFCFF